MLTILTLILCLLSFLWGEYLGFSRGISTGPILAEKIIKEADRLQKQIELSGKKVTDEEFLKLLTKRLTTGDE
jgi:hypothetical protein